MLQVQRSDLKAVVQNLLGIYKQAWEQQDPKLILTAFTPDAVYHERVLKAPMVGHDAIERYWQEKVVQGQANIKFELLNLYIDNDASTAVAEWDATFNDTAQGVRKHMREVAILKIQSGRIAHLREYWSSEVV